MNITISPINPNVPNFIIFQCFPNPASITNYWNFPIIPDSVAFSLFVAIVDVSGARASSEKFSLEYLFIKIDDIIF